MDLRRHIDWVLARVGERGDELRALQTVDGVSMHMHFVWWSAFGQGGPTLWPSHMTQVAALNLETQFEIAFFGED